MKYLKELCLLEGTSGDENRVRDFIISHLGNNPYTVDNLGNIIVQKKGKCTPKNRIMLSAHMDEVGIIITYIHDDGLMSFSTVGGIDPKALLGKRFVLNGHLCIVGTAPVHLSEDSSVMPKTQDMFLDIGAKDKLEAEKYVQLGDVAVFESEYVEFGNGFLKSKAIDDRFGCALLLELLEKELAFDVTVCFVVREEIGLKGAGCAAAKVKPDIGIVFESTTANDVCSVSGADRVCALGEGPVISFMDRATLYDRELYKEAVLTAKSEGIKAQTKTRIAGGNDASAIQIAGEGARVLALSLPTRYIHSSSSVAKFEDMESACKLAYKLIERFGNRD